ncbi:MAG: hypothetical protein IJL05_02955 [Alphaproteobacteria bacterium]|nr:hypothetical protein [Alphaproteobacteria bacterium]
MKIFDKSFLMYNNQHGGMLVELIMSISLAAIIIPFIFRYQQNAVVRARDVAVTKQMESVQNALERYIIENKTVLMQPVGKSIYRIKLDDLTEYGLPDYMAEKFKEDYQLRILKSSDKNNKSTLQGIVILNNEKITPLRTREIVNLGGGKYGFIESDITYGGFGAFHANVADFGVSNTKGIVGTTSVKRGNTEYLWRLPSDKKSDATMLSSLNLDGHDIINIRFLDANKAQFDEKLIAGKIATNSLVFTNRATLDSIFAANNSVVNGALTSDAKQIDVSGTVSLADSGKFSSFYTNDLYVNNLNLNGFSVKSVTGKDSILKIIGDMDLILGHVNATYVSVGYTGSVTPQLSISDKIQDAKDSSYYWDIKGKKARFADALFPELSRLALGAIATESVSGTSSTLLFGAVSANTNATVGDYLNALHEIQTRVRQKYQMLNLE